MPWPFDSKAIYKVSVDYGGNKWNEPQEDDGFDYQRFKKQFINESIKV